MVVYGDDKGITRAFRNLPGVDLSHVSRLNLLQLAPGGHLGRFVIFTASAFGQLDGIYGTNSAMSTVKSEYKLPRSIMTNSDLTRLINVDEVQRFLNPKKASVRFSRQKKNPLKNLGAMVKLNPYALAVRRQELKAQEARAAVKAANDATVKAGKKVKKTPAEAAFIKQRKAHAAAKKANYASLVSEEFYSLDK